MVHPPNSGAKVVIYNRLVELSKHFEITFCCLAEQASDVAAAQRLAGDAEVVLATPAPPERSRWRQWWSLLRDPCARDFAPKLAAWFDSLEMQQLLSPPRPFDVVEIHSACWYRRRLKDLPGLKVLVAHNRESEYYTDRARSVWRIGGWGAAVRAALDALMVRVQERRAIAASDAVVSLAPLNEVQQRRWLGGKPVLCNWGGVDLEYYQTQTTSAPATVPRAAPVLLFIAAFFVENAVDGALRFAQEALPDIASACPGVRLLLVGDHRGNAAIARLVRNHSHVEAVGLVEDVRPYLEAADVVVVPIAHGSGVRYKIMEALAAGKPVVSTHKGAEGLGLVHGRDLVLCDTVAQMAPQVIDLIADTERRRRLAQQARETAREKFGRVSEHRRLAEWYVGLLAER